MLTYIKSWLSYPATVELVGSSTALDISSSFNINWRAVADSES